MRILVFAAAALCVSSAYADIVFNQTVTINGSGLGAVNTLTTGHESTPPGYETGCVMVGLGLTTVESCPSGFQPVDATLDNTAINHVVPFSDLPGIVRGGDLTLVFNVSETGRDLSVNLQNMYLEIASSNGATFFAYLDPALANLELTSGTGTGIGGSGFAFTLNASEAMAANAFTTANCGPGSACAVAGGFTVNNTNDGSETLYVTTVANGLVPEPASLALLGTVLAGIGALKFRRRSRA